MIPSIISLFTETCLGNEQNVIAAVIVSAAAVAASHERGSTMINHYFNRRFLPVILCFVMLMSAVPQPAVYAAESKYSVTRQALSSASSQTNIIFVGDSRTVQMYRDVGEAESSKSSWSAKSAMGYSWMVSTGIPQAEEMMKKGDSIAICMGVNSILLSEAAKYAPYINKKAAEWAAKGVKTYFVSVNPIEDEKKALTNSNKRNSYVVSFNKMVKKALSSKVTYIDTYSALINDFTTLDGTHYPAEINQKVYRLIRDFVKKDNAKKYVKVILHRNRGKADTVQCSLNVFTGQKQTLGGISYTKPGSELAGWAFTLNASVPAVSASQAFTNSWVNKYWPCTDLYAVWKKLPSQSKVTLYRNFSSKDTAHKTQTFKEGQGQKIAASGWTRTGYILTGWSSSPTAEKKGYTLYSQLSDRT